MNFEVEFEDLEERFRTRVIYSDDEHRFSCEEDYKHVQSIKRDWQVLSQEADIAEVKVQHSKQHFASQTQTQVSKKILNSTN